MTYVPNPPPNAPPAEAARVSEGHGITPDEIRACANVVADRAHDTVFITESLRLGRLALGLCSLADRLEQGVIVKRAVYYLDGRTSVVAYIATLAFIALGGWWIAR